MSGTLKTINRFQDLGIFPYFLFFLSYIHLHLKFFCSCHDVTNQCQDFFPTQRTHLLTHVSVRDIVAVYSETAKWQKKFGTLITFLRKFLSVCVQLKRHLPLPCICKKKKPQCWSALTFCLDKCTSAVFLTSRPHSYFYCSHVDPFIMGINCKADHSTTGKTVKTGNRVMFCAGTKRRGQYTNSNSSQRFC